MSSTTWQMVVVDSEEKMNDLISRIQRSGECAVDTETNGLFWALGHKAFVATFSPDLEVSYAITYAPAARRVLAYMEINRKRFVFQSAIFDFHMLRAWCGWYPQNGYRSLVLEDTMHGFRIAFPGEPAGLKIASKRYAQDVDVDGPQKRVHDWLLANRKTKTIAGKLVLEADDFSQVPEEIMLPYATQDTWLTLRSFHGLQKDLLAHERPERFRAPGARQLPHLYDVYRSEIRSTQTVAEMERVGFPVDRERLRHLKADAAAGIELYGTRWHQMGYGDINLKSPVQLKKLFYTTLGEKPHHFSPKTGEPSTGKFAIRDMENREVADTLTYLRGWQKCLERCTEIESFLAPDGRVHASFKGEGARTGRFTCSNPALQNLNRPDEEKPFTMIRSVFAPPPGYEFLFMDFSQIELRLAAEYLKDDVMRQAFVDGVDFHSLTASRTYGVPIDQVTKPMRALCKILNFSILYGAGLRRVVSALRYGAAGTDPLTIKEALSAMLLFDPRYEMPNDSEQLYIHLGTRLLGSYHNENPKVKQFTRSAAQSAERCGYIVTAFGLIVPVPKEESYAAGNAIIQGTAAGLMKETLVRTEDICYDYCAENNFTMWKDVQIVTTIHDEEGMLVPVGHALPLARKMYPRMVDWPMFSTKIDVEFAIVREGSTWAHKEELGNIFEGQAA